MKDAKRRTIRAQEVGRGWIGNTSRVCFVFFPLSFGWEWVDGLRLTARPPLQTKAFVRLP